MTCGTLLTARTFRLYGKVSEPVEFPEPGDGAGDAVLQRGAGAEAGCPGQGRGVGIGAVDVPCLHRKELLAGLAPCRLLDARDVVHQPCGGRVADVVDAVGRRGGGRVGRPGVPPGIALRDDVRDAHYPLDDVVDVGEVAPHVAVVEDLDGAVVEYGVHEEEGRHVGTSPRPVDGEEAQPRGRQSVQLGVGVRHQLVALLGGGIQAHRMGYAVVLGEGNLAVEAVDARR